MGLALSRHLAVESLRSVWLFAGCSDRQLRVVAARVGARTADAGDVIVAEGDDGDELFVLAGGAVAVTRGSMPLATVHRGSFFGEIAVLTCGPRTATVVATEPSVLLAMARSDAMGMLSIAPAVVPRLMLVMAERVRETSTRVVSASARLGSAVAGPVAASA